jgi:hypothetical protein
MTMNPLSLSLAVACALVGVGFGSLINPLLVAPFIVAA